MGVVDDTPVDASTFYWGWKDGMNSTTLSECGTYSISVVRQSNSSSTGVLPYYMVAWKANGIPTVSLIGSDTSNLRWRVNQASGSSLMLTVADSRGTTGGIDPYIYSVENNGTSSCLASSPSTSITLSTNASTSQTLQTCQPLEVQVKGGQKPYTISIAALNSMMVVNMTLGENDDVLTWPNQAGTNTQLIVSVSDANGVWGTSSGIYSTAGENKTDCGISATSRNSADGDSTSTSNIGEPTSTDSGQQHSNSSSSTTLIVAIAVSVAAVILLSILGLFLLRRRRQRLRIGDPQPAIVPDAWTGPSSLISINRDSGMSAKTYHRLARSDDMLLQPRPVVQHEDAADVRELPPPYRDRSAGQSSSSLDTR